MTTQLSNPRFLAVAYSEGKINRRKAWQILDTQEKYRSSGIVMRVGEIAVELGILVESDISKILNTQQQFSRSNKRLLDPLKKHGVKGRRLSRMLIRREAVYGFLSCAIVALVWIIYKKIGYAGAIAGILVIFYSAAKSIFPMGFAGHFAWHRIIRAVIYLVVFVSLAYSFYVGHQMYQHSVARQSVSSTVENADTARTLLNRLLSGLALVAVGLIGILLIAYWRHLEIWHLELRIRLTELIVSRFARGFKPVGHVKSVTDYNRYEELLKRTAIVMRLNPWDNFIAKFLLWRRYSGVVSIWYLEPNTETQTFDIVHYSAPTAPGDVLDAFDVLKEKHHPVMLNEKEYEDAIQSCRKKGITDLKQFMANPGRKKFVSLCGLAYKYKRMVESPNVKKCGAFHDPVKDLFSKGTLTDAAKQWLDFQSAIVYPVFESANSHDDPVGVVVAFKNVENSITPEDKDVLLMTSRLYGKLKSA